MNVAQGRERILRQFSEAMEPTGILYVNMPTYDTALYSEYKDVRKDADGMAEVR